VDYTGEFPWGLLVLGCFALAGLIYGIATDRNLAEEVRPKEIDTSYVKSITLPRPTDALDEDSSNMLGDDLSNDSNKTSPSSNPNNTKANTPLTLKDRLNNAMIGLSLGTFIGGGLVFVGGTLACVGGYASTIVPAFGLTGTQAVAWGMISYNILPIFVAPFLEIDVEVLEYPS